jgi:oligopeptide transport system ATP-binding protein
MTALLQVKGLRKVFRKGKELFVAVDDVSLDIAQGQTVGLVGQSGCGKSTFGKTLLRLHEPSSGAIFFDGVDICTLGPADMRAMRRNIQMIFQDPYASLNPRMTVLDIIGEPLDVHQLATGEKRRARVQELLEMVGLNPDHCSRLPHEFSGGQRQRIGIARALAVNPRFIVCDEPTSALDVSIQAQIINLLKFLQDEMNLTYLFITHNLAVVKFIAHSIAVMQNGKIIAHEKVGS